MQRMTNDELLSFLKNEEEAAEFQQNTLFLEDRKKATRAYLRMPYGTEEDGRSSVVTSDVLDAVEGMLPDLVEVFTGSDKAVVFEPVGPEDEESAVQITNACNYVFYKQNNGFTVLYSALKDGLLLKTGAVKWGYEKKRTPSFARYKAIDENQIAAFLDENPNAEIVEKTEVDPDPSLVAEYLAAGVEQPKFFNVYVKTVAEKGHVYVRAIHPDDLFISSDHDSVHLDECCYVAHVTEQTLSDIREMGFDVSADDMRESLDEEYLNKSVERSLINQDKENPDDESSIVGTLREEYVLVDFDGDGVAERRRILRLGDMILENKECSHVQIAAWTPYILTHQHTGFSVADLVEDFQRIHTEILRNQLDNLALANNQETVVQTDNQGSPLANIDDLLNRRPGGILRERVPGAIRPYSQQWQGIQANPMLEQLSVEKENRTGWTRYSQGLDSNSLNKTMGGMQMIMNSSQKRMKLMARIAAETLVAPMFRGIFKTLTDSDIENISYRLNGKFVNYSISEWNDQYDMTVNVGIGSGDIQQQSQFLQQIAQAQAAAIGSPLAGTLITPKNIYNLQARLVENAGFKNPGEFWTDPDTVPPKPPQPGPVDPIIEIEKAKLMNDQHKTQAKFQIDQQKSQSDLQAEREKFEAKLRFDAEQAALDRQNSLIIEAMRIQAAALKNNLTALPTDEYIANGIAAVVENVGDQEQ